MHLIQRGNNRAECFFDQDDYLVYLDWSERYAAESECDVHAYVLMTNHVHLLLTPQVAGGASELMKRLGQRYVQYVNRKYDRTGTLWEGRFRSCLIEEERYLLSCYRYIELNPVRARMVEHPEDYRWSSYRANARGQTSTLLVPHGLYTQLGGDERERQLAYRELFPGNQDPGMIDSIRAATNGNFALGGSRFQTQIAATLGRRVSPGKSGRPSRKK